MAGYLWHLPVIRLDLGAVFGSLVGESEANIRRAIQLSEAVAPCVLVIDEMEKGFAGAGGGGEHDSGTASRVFGKFLTWMQEKESPVFVVATVNRIEALPPELLRKGRFDELFMLDLPNRAERAAILAAHLEKRGRRAQDFPIEELAARMEGFSGAEIEQVVKEALLDAFDAGRELEADDLAQAASRTVPLSTTMAEQIAALREWGKKRARPASAPLEREKAGAELEI